MVLVAVIVQRYCFYSWRNLKSVEPVEKTDESYNISLTKKHSDEQKQLSSTAKLQALRAKIPLVFLLVSDQYHIGIGRHQQYCIYLVNM